MKIAITGHTSGIGKAISDIQTLKGAEIKGYSRSNGWNLAERDGILLLEELIEYNPDIFFNNAWHPKVQNMLCMKLHDIWKDKHKVIINTGSATAYVPSTGTYNGDNYYANDKKELAEYCILQSFRYPYENKCRLINFSWGFVETGIVGTSDRISKEALIDATEAAKIMMRHAEDAWERKEKWAQPEIVINRLYNSEKERQSTFTTAARGVAKHLIKTKKSIRTSQAHQPNQENNT